MSHWVENDCVGCPPDLPCINCGKGDYFVFVCDQCGAESNNPDDFIQEDNEIDICEDCYEAMNAMHLIDAYTLVNELKEAGVSDIEKICDVIQHHGVDYSPYQAYINVMSSDEIKDGMIPVDAVLGILRKEARWDE